MTARKKPRSPDETRRALEPQSHRSAWGRTTPGTSRAAALRLPVGTRQHSPSGSGPGAEAPTDAQTPGAGWGLGSFRKRGDHLLGALGRLSRLNYSCFLPSPVDAESRLRVALTAHAPGRRSSSRRPAWARGEQGRTGAALWMLTAHGSLRRSLLVGAGEDAPPNQTDTRTVETKRKSRGYTRSPSLRGNRENRPNGDLARARKRAHESGPGGIQGPGRRPRAALPRGQPPSPEAVAPRAGQWPRRGPERGSRADGAESLAAGHGAPRGGTRAHSTPNPFLSLLWGGRGEEGRRQQPPRDRKALRVLFSHSEKMPRS